MKANAKHYDTPTEENKFADAILKSVYVKTL